MFPGLNIPDIIIFQTCCFDITFAVIVFIILFHKGELVIPNLHIAK